MLDICGRLWGFWLAGFERVSAKSGVFAERDTLGFAVVSGGVLSGIGILNSGFLLVGGVVAVVAFEALLAGLAVVSAT
ncbi:hypothetical protein D777_02250 [Marinobacter nitratireducens]|uniref:Uncharacterized protein n=1 Tax=Marinobacter nitratireducens TaxID=1137280 RepID=A0A072N1P8_9GAMM|nr:hypothetical protein D777_02250 [Marinobacter nitratireducens]